MPGLYARQLPGPLWPSFLICAAKARSIAGPDVCGSGWRHSDGMGSRRWVPRRPPYTCGISNPCRWSVTNVVRSAVIWRRRPLMAAELNPGDPWHLQDEGIWYNSSRPVVLDCTRAILTIQRLPSRVGAQTSGDSERRPELPCGRFAMRAPGWNFHAQGRLIWLRFSGSVLPPHCQTGRFGGRAAVEPVPRHHRTGRDSANRPTPVRPPPAGSWYRQTMFKMRPAIRSPSPAGFRSIHQQNIPSPPMS